MKTNRLMLYTRLLWPVVLVIITPFYAHGDFTVSGVNNGLKRILVEQLNTIEFPCDASAAKRLGLQKKSDAKLRQSLEALGYFNGHWENQFVLKKQCWQLQYNLTIGAPARIRQSNIHIQGEATESPAFNNLIQQSKLQTGALFDSAQYEKLKENIQATALRLGFFNAAFIEQRVDIYPTDNAADISLVWDSGTRYRFGDIQIKQSVLKPALFQELLSIKSGDFYDLSRIQNDRLRLSESGYFTTIEIKPLLQQRLDGKVPVHIQATPGNPDSYQAGVGFSTDTGARVRGDYTRHRFNSLGHKGEVSLLLSEVLQTLNLNYTAPWRNPKTDSLRADLSYIDENNESFESRRWETSITGNTKRSSGWNQSISATLTTEEGEVADDVDRTIHLVPAISLSKLSADDLIYPKRGYSLALNVSGSREGIVSDSSFIQLETSLKIIRTLPFKFRFLARTELGFTLADSIDDVPVSRRFFSGGDNSIRGYDYQSLGPMEDGEVIGGRHLATASIELERPVYKKWALAAFVDGGNAWDEGDIDPVLGVGMGVRWHSPIGPLRVDIGVPLEAGESGFRIHLSLGPEL